MDNAIKNVLITGASVSYNHYCYDEIFRINAHECYAGMQSWSFRLRDFLTRKNSGFVDANNIAIIGAEKVLPETLNINQQNFINFENCTVLKIDKTTTQIELNLNDKLDKVVLHMQNVLKNSCSFDIVFGDCSFNFNNQGDENYFQGMSPEQIELKCSVATSSVIFNNFRFSGEVAYIVLTGYSLLSRKVFLSGKGATLAQFMVDNFDERIGKYNPDLIIFTTAANDRFKSTPDEYKKSLITLFGMMKKGNKNCKIIAVHLVDDSTLLNEKGEIMQSKPFFDVLKEVSLKENVTVFDMNEVFRGISPDEWKIDNIHLNKYGNNLMFDSFSSFLIKSIDF